MSFEPPGNHLQDVDYRNKSDNSGFSQNNNNSFYRRSRQPLLSTPPDCSPLLRTPDNFSNTNENGFVNTQSTVPPLIGPQDFKAPIYNRLGRSNNYQSRNHNKNHETSSDNKTDNWNRYNRKRASDGGGGGSHNSKRRWGNKPYQSSSSLHNQQTSSNFAQNRMERLRSLSTNQLDITEAANMNESTIKVEIKSPPPGLDEAPDVDATDITVQIVNDGPQKRIQDEDLLHRFKMILDPKAQTAIRLIQEKRKEKQVIFPFPVTPNVTQVSLHDRFTSL